MHYKCYDYKTILVMEHEYSRVKAEFYEVPR